MNISIVVGELIFLINPEFDICQIVHIHKGLIWTGSKKGLISMLTHLKDHLK